MNLLNVGIEHTLDTSERRNIKLANFMSFLMATAMMMIVGFRAGMGVLKGWFFVPMVLEAIVILALIVLTALGKNVVSRVLLCWIPAIFLIIDFRIVLLHSGAPETSHYLGFRIFQLSFGCFPLLLFNTNHWKRVAIGLSVPVACVIFFDTILDWMGIGYTQMGLTDSSYSFNIYRTFISFFVIASSFAFLKRIIERQEQQNAGLIQELDEKNKIIKQQADDEVSQLNQQLLANLNELSRAQANLSATINNTEILIWSVDSNFDLITSNQPFREFVKEVYDVTVTNTRLDRQFPEHTRMKWHERYKRVMTGEVVVIEDSVRGSDFRFSLSPIIEGYRITGVTVFGDNITDQKRHHRELADANRKINELKMMALKSVMNPHFIFNVLSSIQYFITKNDELNAIHYLSSFSKLMRTVLSRSVVDDVTVKEEIDLIENYVHLEKLRFDDKFSFSMEYDKEMEIDHLRIPSLLIQPYVENAIVHGLCHKKEPGSLIVRVKMNDDYLIFDVEDDGIGREAAGNLRAKNQPVARSMGTHLTEERLRLLNADSNVAVSYSDLKKDDQPAGTLVQIRIKITDN